MKIKIRISIYLLTLALILASLPLSASAHGNHVFEINGKSYLFVVGSLNEPAYTGDKSGVDLRIKLADPKNPTASDAPGALPVLGLEKTLKAEIQANNQKRIFDLTAVYNTPGSYKAVFYPTLATTYTYRLVGTIDGVAVDLSFACNPTGHGNATPNTERVELGSNVYRTFTSGGFGCFEEQNSIAFPSPTPSRAPLIISLIALALSIVAVVKRKK